MLFLEIDLRCTYHSVPNFEYHFNLTFIYILEQSGALSYIIL